MRNAGKICACRRSPGKVRHRFTAGDANGGGQIGWLQADRPQFFQARVDLFHLVQFMYGENLPLAGGVPVLRRLIVRHHQWTIGRRMRLPKSVYLRLREIPRFLVAEHDAVGR